MGNCIGGIRTNNTAFEQAGQAATLPIMPRGAPSTPTRNATAGGTAPVSPPSRPMTPRLDMLRAKQTVRLLAGGRFYIDENTRTITPAPTVNRNSVSP
jgi:hypothetical protein